MPLPDLASFTRILPVICIKIFLVFAWHFLVYKDLSTVIAADNGMMSELGAPPPKLQKLADFTLFVIFQPQRPRKNIPLPHRLVIIKATKLWSNGYLHPAKPHRIPKFVRAHVQVEASAFVDLTSKFSVLMNVPIRIIMKRGHVTVIFCYPHTRITRDMVRIRVAGDGSKTRGTYHCDTSKKHTWSHSNQSNVRCNCHNYYLSVLKKNLVLSWYFYKLIFNLIIFYLPNRFSLETTVEI